MRLAEASFERIGEERVEIGNALGAPRGENGGDAARLLSFLPSQISAELCALASGRKDYWARIEELRLRAEGRCSAVFRGRQSLLRARLDAEQMQALLLRLCGGSLYAYEECIAEGYLPMENGMRVGVCGRARYEGEALRGICEVRSLVFRFPHPAPQAAAAAVTEAFSRARRGLLIYAPPGVGKTTALRALALSLGRQMPPRRVVVVDERMEFSPREYAEATVDILRGYRRAQGLQIAHRSLSPEVVMIDEIGGFAEASEMAALLRGGAIAVATAHARSREDLYARGALAPFMERGIFDVFLRIQRENGKWDYEIEDAWNREADFSKCFAI